MADRPILFSAPMVRALLDGRKSQTRRIIKPQPIVHPAGNWSWEGRNGGFVGAAGTHLDEGFPETARFWAPIQPSDILWVREAHYLTDDGHYERAVYAADEEAVREHNKTMERLAGRIDEKVWRRHVKLRPSIHMPRWASRLTLTVTDVRVQRLQEISEADARAEGAEHNGPCDHSRQACSDIGCFGPNSYRGGFAEVWWEINGIASWDANPWVAAYTFTVERRNIDAEAS